MDEQEELSSERQERILLIQRLFASFNQEQTLTQFDETNLPKLLEDVLSDEVSEQKSAVETLRSIARNENLHSKLAEAGTIEVLTKVLSRIDFTSPSISRDKFEVYKLVLNTLAKIADVEKETPRMVKAGLLPVLIQIVLLIHKNPVRKHSVRILHHIAESVFLRGEIVRVLRENFPDKEISFIERIVTDPYDKQELEFWKELLRNTDLIREQYKPGKAWHNPADFPCTKLLEENYHIIKQEAMSIQQEALRAWPEKNLYIDGWDVLGLFAFKNKLEFPCTLCPKTTSVLEKIPGLQTALFSCLKPRCHIKPHVGYYQYSEKILRVHMGLVVPTGCVLKVNGIEGKWEEGKCIVFDDTFRHEAWNPSCDTTRIVLMLDIEYNATSDERNKEFFETSQQHLEKYGRDALISRDLIEALTSYGAKQNNNFRERPT